MTKKTEKVYGFRFEPALINKLRTLAANDKRALNNYIARVLDNHVKKWQWAESERQEAESFADGLD